MTAKTAAHAVLTFLAGSGSDEDGERFRTRPMPWDTDDNWPAGVAQERHERRVKERADE